MLKSFNRMLDGYKKFQQKYAAADNAFFSKIAEGQSPEIMIVACCDSRVDPALLLQCDPGDLFIVRNVASIVPPYENDEAHYGTSAALEFGLCYLNVKHLIILGHSQCGGVQALFNQEKLQQDDFISNWIKLINVNPDTCDNADNCAKEALLASHQNCLTFPWLKQKIAERKLMVHLWFFEIKEGLLFTYNFASKNFEPLNK